MTEPNDAHPAVKHPIYSMVKVELHRLKSVCFAGIYVLYHQGRITYVGQSCDVYCRVYSHLCSGIPFDSWRAIPVDDLATRQFLETVLIQVLQPDGNFNTAINAAWQTLQRQRNPPPEPEYASPVDMEKELRKVQFE